MRPSIVTGVILVGLFVSGCSGPTVLRTKGRLVKGGAPLTYQDGESPVVTLIPVNADGKPPADFYFCETDRAAGTFTAAGKNGKGVPPGKYKVAVELMNKKKDSLAGKFDAVNTPFVFDIDGKTTELVIDLDKPQG